MKRDTRTVDTRMINASKIRLIKTALRQLDMSDTDYRALLMRTAGVSSSTSVTLEAFDLVMAEFHRLGFRYVPSRKPPKGSVATGAPGRPSLPQLRLIERRARDLGFTGMDDPGFVRWMKARAHVEHPRFMDGHGARRVIAALGKWIENNKRKQQR